MIINRSSSNGKKITLVIFRPIKLLKDLIKEREQFIKERGIGAVGALMGPVMSEFRGKMDGGDINKILMKKIKEIL